MPFVQRKLEKSVNQTRDIFDKFIYRPDNGDGLDDVKVPGYFADSRFDSNMSIVEAQLSDGYFFLAVDSEGNAVQFNPVDMVRMSLASEDDITIDGTLAAPSYFTGLFTLNDNDPGFVPTLTGPGADEDTGAVVNNTGEVLSMTGLISIESDTGGFTSAVTVWSEFSDDGITWTPQTSSKRDWSISFIAEGSQTNESGVAFWQPGQYLRFAFAQVGGVPAILSNSPIIVNGDQEVDGFSVKWSLTKLS